MRSLEQSYLRLGLDRIDIVLIHDVDASTHGSDEAAEPRFEQAMEGAYRALVELRKAGQIRRSGRESTTRAGAAGSSRRAISTA